MTIALSRIRSKTSKRFVVLEPVGTLSIGSPSLCLAGRRREDPVPGTKCLIVMVPRGAGQRVFSCIARIKTFSLSTICEIFLSERPGVTAGGLRNPSRYLEMGRRKTKFFGKL